MPGPHVFLLRAFFYAREMAWVVFACVLAGCATPPPEPADRVQAPLAGRFTPEQSQDVTLYALSLVGTPYRFGGNTPQSGFDCSGLIYHVYQSRVGLKPPRTVAQLQNWGQPLAADDLRAGDLVLFFQRGVVSHAGIYVGNMRFVHAPSTGGAVRLDSLQARYWAAQETQYMRP